MKAVIFDLDGVIVNTVDYHFEAWQEVARKIGITIDKKFNEQLKGISRMESLERILKHGNVINQYSEEKKNQLAFEKNEIYMTLIKKLDPSAVFPNILKLLLELKKQGIQVGLASASKNGLIILDALKLRKYFNVVINPALIERGKPAPDIFIECAKLLNVNPIDCVAIEDAPSGIQAIKSANMIAIGIGLESELTYADQIFESTKHLNIQALFDIWEDYNLRRD